MAEFPQKSNASKKKVPADRGPQLNLIVSGILFVITILRNLLYAFGDKMPESIAKMVLKTPKLVLGFTMDIWEKFFELFPEGGQKNIYELIHKNQWIPVWLDFILAVAVVELIYRIFKLFARSAAAEVAQETAEDATSQNSGIDALTYTHDKEKIMARREEYKEKFRINPDKVKKIEEYFQAIDLAERVNDFDSAYKYIQEIKKQWSLDEF